VAQASGGSGEGEAGPVDPTDAPRYGGAWGPALGERRAGEMSCPR
jgi:hypothetical protein